MAPALAPGESATAQCAAAVIVTVLQFPGDHTWAAKSGALPLSGRPKGGQGRKHLIQLFLIGGKSYESGSHHGNTERQCCDGRPRRKAGEEVHYFRAQNSALSSPRTSPCHKIAVAPIAKGAHIIKYGEIIGGAVDIPVELGLSPGRESLPRIMAAN